MTFNGDISIGNIITWIVFLCGIVVGWVKVIDKVEMIQNRFEKHDLECSEKNREAASLRIQQAQIQSSTVTQLASLATTIASMEQRMNTLDQRQWKNRDREG